MNKSYLEIEFKRLIQYDFFNLHICTDKRIKTWTQKEKWMFEGNASR